MRRLFALVLLALLGFAQPALAISNPVALGTKSNDGSTTDVITTSTNDCPVGSLAIVLAGYSTIADTLSSVSDNSSGGPNTWTVIDNTTRTGLGLGIAYSNVAHDIAIADTITLTFAGSTASGASAICVVSGIVSSSPLDTHNHTSTGTTSPASSVSTGILAQASELVLGNVTTSNSTTNDFTVGGSFTEIGTFDGAIGADVSFGYQIVSSTASVDWAPSWSVTTTAYVSDVVSFKGAAAAAAPKRTLLGVGAWNDVAPIIPKRPANDDAPLRIAVGQ